MTWKYSWLILLAINTYSGRIASSSNVESIKINGVAPHSVSLDYLRKNFPDPKPMALSNSSYTWAAPYSTFVLEHLFEMECFSALNIRITVDDYATIFFNDQ
jgi:hypothetical protein